MLITNNKLLITAAERNYDKFAVPTSLVSAIKRKRYYNNSDKCDLDIKTSVNKIGEIVNLSQELNTLFWNNIHSGQTFEDNQKLYDDIVKLAILSNVEIDKAKKEYQLDSTEEIGILKKKYLRKDKKDRYIKPNFFGHLARTKGYYNSKRKNYKKHHTTMDYVQTAIRRFHIPRYRWDGTTAQIPFLAIVDRSMYEKGQQNYSQIRRVLDVVREAKADIQMVYAANHSSGEEKYRAVSEIKERCSDFITNLKMTTSTMYFLLKELEKPENKDITMSLLNILFNSRNGAFFDLILTSKEPVGHLEEDANGIIHLYGINYIEVKQ